MNATAILDLKARVRERDGQRCTNCGMTNAVHVGRYGRILDVHRIEPGGPYSFDGCRTLCKVCHGPEPKSPHGSGLLKGYVKLPARLAYRIRRIAAHRKKSVPDYLAEILGPIIDQHEAKMLDELAKERKKPRSEG